MEPAAPTKVSLPLMSRLPFIVSPDTLTKRLSNCEPSAYAVESWRLVRDWIRQLIGQGLLEQDGG